MEISVGRRGLTPTSHHTHISKLPKAKELKVRNQDFQLWEENLGDYNIMAWGRGGVLSEIYHEGKDGWI